MERNHGGVLLNLILCLIFGLGNIWLLIRSLTRMISAGDFPFKMCLMLAIYIFFAVFFFYSAAKDYKYLKAHNNKD